ncbi:fimbrial protein [Burkholderia sp. BCC1630]|uniref:fimbrial protein n=1 Tax=Burkholderia sp. BCC1630 TaxID=2676304 RepID=UPI00158DA7B1|nr:fimbrial protein [Burkholderia sp. BCC1630]
MGDVFLSINGSPVYDGKNIGIDGRQVGLWKTNLPGIDVAYYLKFFAKTPWSGYQELKEDGFVNGSSLDHDKFPLEFDQMKIDGDIYLVKVGAVKSGVVTIHGLSLGNNDDPSWVTKFHPNPSSIQIVLPTCEILTKQIGVSMGNDISLSKFTGPGTTSDFKPFTVSMTCPTGINKLSYLMNGAGGSKIDPSQPGTLSLSNANGASGVGVQVKDDDNKAFVNLGHAMPVGQYQPDQDNQHIDLKFEAAYIQTGAKVTGGDADAQATITMSYE